MSNSWKRVAQMLNAPKLKRWYKKLVHRRNRRAAKQNPDAKDKRLNPWDID
jgi:hypothetical protein